MPEAIAKPIEQLYLRPDGIDRGAGRPPFGAIVVAVLTTGFCRYARGRLVARLENVRGLEVHVAEVEPPH